MIKGCDSVRLLLISIHQADETSLPEDEHFGVIAPYQAQVGKIRQLLTKGHKGIKVGSVEEFQGQVCSRSHILSRRADISRNDALSSFRLCEAARSTLHLTSVILWAL